VNMKAILVVCLVLLTLGRHAPVAAQVGDGDARIRMLTADWERAWNTHDMRALAALFTEDADFVNVGAKRWKGRKEIEAQHALRLSQFLGSVWATRSAMVQYLKPDIALVHVEWGLKGDKDPDGTPREPRAGLFTWLVVKDGRNWLIRAAQNTNLSNLPPPAGANETRKR
jgi:uncharacterized protein (TIGR02246 family)